MGKVRRVTPSQVAAAKLVVEMDLEDGKVPDPVAVKIANATPLDPWTVDDEFIVVGQVLPKRQE